MKFQPTAEEYYAMKNAIAAARDLSKANNGQVQRIECSEWFFSTITTMIYESTGKYVCVADQDRRLIVENIEGTDKTKPSWAIEFTGAY